MKLRTLFAGALALAPLALAACSGDSTGTSAPGQVQLRFGVATGASALRASDGLANAVGGPLVLTGSNGTLSINSIRVVVAKFQLRGLDDQPCADGTFSNDDSPGDDGGECEFNAGPFFLDVPLDGSQLTVTTGAVKPGTFDRVRFRVKNLDDDDDDAGDDDSVSPAAVQALFQQIRAQFPDWPRKASMRVDGTFTPTGGAARPFSAYLRAEVRVTLPLNPPLTVAEGNANNDVTILLDPATFFRNGGAVVDLSAFNGSLGEIEVRDGVFRGEGHHGSGG